MLVHALPSRASLACCQKDTSLPYWNSEPRTYHLT